MSALLVLVALVVVTAADGYHLLGYWKARRP